LDSFTPEGVQPSKISGGGPARGVGDIVCGVDIAPVDRVDLRTPLGKALDAAARRRMTLPDNEDAVVVPKVAVKTLFRGALCN